MSLTLTPHWWMAVPAAVTLVWLYAIARCAWYGELDGDTLPMLLFFWACTAGPALLAGWIA